MKKIPVRNISSSREPSSGRFSIRKVQDVLDGKELLHDLHRHNFFFVLVLQAGEGIHEIDFTPHKVVDHSVFLLRPGQVHQLHLKAGSTGYLMEFDNEFYHPQEKAAVQRLRKASGKNYCQPEVTRFEKLNAVLSNIFEEYTNKQEGYQEAIKANLEIFYIEFMRQSADPGNAVTPARSYIQERYEEFIDLLESHLTTLKQVSQYTDLMNLSSYQLNEITKTAVGKTASALIDEYIILETKRYLLATPNQIKDVADHLGYEDVSYFIRFFKKHTGYSPDAFRRNFK